MGATERSGLSRDGVADTSPTRVGRGFTTDASPSHPNIAPQVEGEGDHMKRPMGRPLSKNEKTGILLPEDLKLALGVEALRQGKTISEVIAEALRGHLRAFTK